MAVPIMLKTDQNTDIPEGNTALMEFILTDYDHVTPVPVSAVDTATLTLYHNDTGDIINERDDVDVKSKLDSNGKFSMILDADDNVVIATGDNVDSEVHSALITITATGAEGAIVFKREFWMTILNQRKVPNYEEPEE